MATSSETVHATLLNAWLAAPRYANIRLVARLASPILGNPDSSQAYVFIPDLHLVSDEKLHSFSYGTNNWETLYRSMFRLAQVRQALTSAGTTLRVTQMGDLFDLWRDGHCKTRNSVQEIVKSWSSLLKLLYRAPNDPNCLRASLLVGNHDSQMAGSVGWNLRIFYPEESAKAFALALHGDWFDPLEQLPDWLARAVLVIAGKAPKAKTYPVAEMQELLSANATRANGFRDFIQSQEPSAIGAALPCGPTTSLPLEHNVLRTSKGQTHEFLANAVKLVDTSLASAGTSPGFTNLKLIVMGHSHHPRIAIDDTREPPLVLLDTGAWIERYRDADGHTGPNCQLAVVCGNDARIYQFDPL